MFYFRSILAQVLARYSALMTSIKSEMRLADLGSLNGKCQKGVHAQIKMSLITPIIHQIFTGPIQVSNNRVYYCESSTLSNSRKYRMCLRYYFHTISLKSLFMPISSCLFFREEFSKFFLECLVIYKVHNIYKFINKHEFRRFVNYLINNVMINL